MSIFHHTISREYRIIQSKILICSLLVPEWELASRDTYISFFGNVKEGKWKIVAYHQMFRKTEEDMQRRISADEALGISVTVLPEDVKSN